MLRRCLSFVSTLAIAARLVLPLQAAGAPTTAPAGPPAVAPSESILAEDVPNASPNPDPPPYTLLRFNENYSYLSDPRNRADIFDPVKYISLGDDPARYLGFSGEVRERYENLVNPGFGTRGTERSDYLLQRITFGVDLHVNERLRFYAQGISGLDVGRCFSKAATSATPA